MNPLLETYYTNRIEMFGTDAWKDLIEDVTVMRDSVDRIGGIKTESELMFKKGELSIINWLLSLQKVSEETFEELEKDE